MYRRDFLKMVSVIPFVPHNFLNQTDDNISSFNIVTNCSLEPVFEHAQLSYYESIPLLEIIVTVIYDSGKVEKYIGSEKLISKTNKNHKLQTFIDKTNSKYTMTILYHNTKIVLSNLTLIDIS